MPKTIPPLLTYLQHKLLELRKKQKIEMQNGDVGYASAPSNIALVKYWGKEAHLSQVPLNSSLSLTIGGFRSFTKVTALGRFFPEGEENLSAKFSHKLTLKDENGEVISEQIPKKMENFLNAILSPFAQDIGIHIESINNFPTACGIASSASGYAALVGAIANLLQLDKYFTNEELQYWLSEWARLGSGSATRSTILNKNSLFVSWERLGENNNLCTKTLDIPFHENWKYVKHCVFVLDDKEKSISSSEGHKLANSSPLHAIRVANIEKQIQNLKKAISEFDFNAVGQITEEDAFAMHAVMQTGKEPACYLTFEVANVISEFLQFRNKLGVQAFWTLDAGPNVHFIYHEKDEGKMLDFFEELKIKLSKNIKIYENISISNSLQLGFSKNGFKYFIP